MYNALTHLNYLAVLGTAVAGFMIGWLWYSVLFGKAWKVEMKITDEKMKECAEQGMAKFFIQGFIYTLLSTVGLAVLIRAHARWPASRARNWAPSSGCSSSARGC